MIWFLLAFVISVVIGIKESGFAEFMLSLIIGCFIALLICVVIREAMPDQYVILREEKLVKVNSEEPYVSVMNNDASTGRDSTSPTLVFSAIESNGSIVTYRTSVKSGYVSKTIVETDSIEPKYVRQKMRPMYKYWQWFAVNFASSEYVIYVPKGGINYDYNVK